MPIFTATRTLYGAKLTIDDLLLEANAPRIVDDQVKVTLSVSNESLIFRDSVNLTSSRRRKAVLKQLAESGVTLDELTLMALDVACREAPPPDVPEPEEDPDPADVEPGWQLLNEVAAFLGRFVAHPTDHTRIAHVLWITHTHLMDVWDTTPRLAFLSPEPASGKTRALEVTELLVPRPVQTVNVSAAYVFRKIDDPAGLPTVLLDEADTIFGIKVKTDHEELRGVLNAGYRRGATAGRCAIKGETVETVEFPAYSAVVLAGLGDLPDTITTRSVQVRMRRRAPNERVEPFRRRLEEATGYALRDRLDRWARSIRRTVVDPWPELPAEVQDRDADIWEPLIALADAAGGDWPERARKAAIALVEEAKESSPSLGIRLLSDLRTIFGDADQMFTDTILDKLHAIDDAPWSEILQGKPLNTRGLAKRLAQYSVKSKSCRVGEKTAKGYKREDLYENWLRYLPPPTNSDGEPYPPEASHPSQNGETPENPSEHAGKSVTFSKLQNVTLPSQAFENVTNEVDRSPSVTDVTDVTLAEGKERTCKTCGNPLEPHRETECDACTRRRVESLGHSEIYVDRWSA